MLVTLEDGTEFEVEDEPIGGGAGGHFHREVGGARVARLYGHSDPETARRLRSLVSQGGPDVGEPTEWRTLFAWPEAVVVKPSLGVVVPWIGEPCRSIDWYLSPRARRRLAEKHGADSLGTWANSASLSVKLARAFRLLHQRGLAHPGPCVLEFKADPPRNRLVMVGCDDLVVPGLSAVPWVAMRHCWPPELNAAHAAPGKRNDPSAQTDLHALAVLVYWLLLQRHPLLGPQHLDADADRSERLALGEQALFIEHPTNKANRPPDLEVPFQSMLTPQVQDLVLQAFVTGLHEPSRRPTAAEWEHALSRMLDSLVPCANRACPSHWFVLQPKLGARCPACGTQLVEPRQLPVLSFYRPVPGRSGHYQNDLGYVMMGWPGRTLHSWHADPTMMWHTGVDDAPKAALEFDADLEQWRLGNSSLVGLRHMLPDGGAQEVAVGQSVELGDGMRLLLGPSDCARLVYVQMLKLG